MNKEKLVFEVVEGVTTPWEGELMSLRFLLLRVENSSLGPQGTCPLASATRFAVPLTLSEQRKVGIDVTRPDLPRGRGKFDWWSV